MANRSAKFFPVEIPLTTRFGFDFSDLLEKPAGERGFLEARPDGHFYFPDGTRGRFWGVNLGHPSIMMPHKTAEGVAERLASLGTNMVRVHAFDAWRDGIPVVIDYEHYDDSRHLSAERLDELDYLIYQLKLRGIYTYMDLLDWREFRPGDGLPQTDLLRAAAKPACVWNERLIELQQEYATDLLTHRNPYTGLCYTDDPAIAVVEITNETSIFWQQWLDLPSFYRDEAQRIWNEWLLRRYGSRAGLDEAWTNYQGERALLPDEDPGKGTVRLPNIVKSWNRLGWEDRAYSDPLTSPARCNDGSILAYELERSYYRQMRDHLRAIGVKVPISACVTSYVPPDLKAVADELDFISNGMYFDHPDWSVQVSRDIGRPLVYGRTGLHTNNSDTRATSTSAPVPRVSLGKIAGKPVILREWNLPYPNEHRSTIMLQMAAYACLQDWDGLLFFAWGADRQPLPNMLASFNAQGSCNDPEHACLYPLAARLFLRRDVATAQHMLDIGFSETDTFYSWNSHLEDPSLYASYIARVQKRFFGADYPGGKMALASGATSSGNYAQAERAVLHASNPYRDLHNKAMGREAITVGCASGLRFEEAHLPDLQIPLDQHGKWARFEGFGFDDVNVLRSYLPMIRVSSLPPGAQPIGVDGDYCVGYVDDRRLVVPHLSAIQAGAHGRRAAVDLHVYGRMLLDALRRWDIADTSHRDIDQGVLRSETGELWRDFDQGIVRIDTAQTQAAIGFIGGRKVETSNLVTEMETPHCVVALTSLDAAPIAESKRLLMAVIGSARNTNQDIRKGIVYTFGEPPVLYRPAAGTITLRALREPDGLEAFACDVDGQRLASIALEGDPSQVSLQARTDLPIAYYELVRRK